MTDKLIEAVEAKGSEDLSLLLADCRQALFDEVNSDEGASNGLRYEIGRAVALMGKAIAALTPPDGDEIERVARALYACDEDMVDANLGQLEQPVAEELREAMNLREPFDVLHHETQQAYRVRARAALSSMGSREEEMREALEAIDRHVSHGLMGDRSIALREIRAATRKALGPRP